MRWPCDKSLLRTMCSRSVAVKGFLAVGSQQNPTYKSNKEISALFEAKGRWGWTSSRQPLTLRQTTLRVPCGPQAIYKPPAQWEGPGSSLLCCVQAVWPWASHFTSLVPGFLIPTAEKTAPSQGCWGAITSLGLIMVTNTIVAKRPRRTENWRALEEELSEAPGPGLQKTHDCETRGRLSSWGFRPQVLRRGASLPQTSLPSQLGPRTATASLPGVWGGDT